MLDAKFQQYLRDVKRSSKRTIGSRTSNCKRVERYEGDLDKHFDNDQCQGLLSPNPPMDRDGRGEDTGRGRGSNRRGWSGLEFG